MSGSLALIKNSKEYWDFIRDLRNNKQVKQGFIQQDNITKKEHLQYMQKYGVNYYVCLCDNEPAGYVGIINKDIRVATHPQFQGYGIGTFMINEIIKIMPDSIAKIRLDNPASIALFEKCGFKKKYYILEKD